MVGLRQRQSRFGAAVLCNAGQLTFDAVSDADGGAGIHPFAANMADALTELGAIRAPIPEAAV
jgi:hypothetical protein